MENHPDTDQRKATLSHENSSSGRICESIAELPSDSIADPAVADRTVFDTQSLYSFPAVPNLVDCTLEGDFRRRVNSVPASHFSPGKIRPRRGSDASHFHGEDRGDSIVLKVLPEDFLDNGKLNLIPGDFEAPTTGTILGPPYPFLCSEKIFQRLTVSHRPDQTFGLFCKRRRAFLIKSGVQQSQVAS